MKKFLFPCGNPSSLKASDVARNRKERCQACGRHRGKLHLPAEG
jgi:hypothetical protein